MLGCVCESVYIHVCLCKSVCLSVCVYVRVLYVCAAVFMFTLAEFLHLKYTCGSTCVLLSASMCVLMACAEWNSVTAEEWAEEAAPARGGSSEVGSPSCVAIGGLVLGVTWTQPLLSCAALPGQVFLQWVHR